MPNNTGKKISRIFGSCVFILLSAQIVFGCVWGILNFTSFQEFPESAEMILLSFPGDEKSSGGCLAAGRGFFHINSHGDAEPCPFSPYSDTNIRDCTLRDALKSGLFRKLNDSGILMQDHTGGCVLFQHREFVEDSAAGVH